MNCQHEKQEGENTLLCPNCVNTGKEQERTALIEKIEEMRKELFVFAPRNSQASETNKLYNFYNQALDGVLHLLDEPSRL